METTLRQSCFAVLSVFWASAGSYSSVLFRENEFLTSSAKLSLNAEELRTLERKCRHILSSCERLYRSELFLRQGRERLLQFHLLIELHRRFGPAKVISMALCNSLAGVANEKSMKARSAPSLFSRLFSEERFPKVGLPENPSVVKMHDSVRKLDRLR